MVVFEQPPGEPAAVTGGETGSSQMDTPGQDRRLPDPNPEHEKKSLAEIVYFQNFIQCAEGLASIRAAARKIGHTGLPVGVRLATGMLRGGARVSDRRLGANAWFFGAFGGEARQNS
jgi:hypothetical protein